MPDPVRVHAHGQRGRRGVAGETTLAGRHLGEAEAPAAVVGGNGGGEVAERPELGQVLLEVGVCPVEVAGAGPEAFQHLGRQFGADVGSGDGGGDVHVSDDAQLPLPPLCRPLPRG
jgi:hypothetical protein